MKNHSFDVEVDADIATQFAKAEVETRDLWSHCGLKDRNPNYRLVSDLEI